MHELALSRGIVDAALRNAGGRRVRSVTVTIGALRQVVPDSLEFYFGLSSRGTLCDGAVMEQRLAPARLSCDTCGALWELDEPDFRCPECGRGDWRVVSGDELTVESIEVEA